MPRRNICNRFLGTNNKISISNDKVTKTSFAKTLRSAEAYILIIIIYSRTSNNRPFRLTRNNLFNYIKSVVLCYITINIYIST